MTLEEGRKGYLEKQIILKDKLVLRRLDRRYDSLLTVGLVWISHLLEGIKIAPREGIYVY